jgi:hypothetical protein
MYVTALATMQPLSTRQTQPEMRAHDFFCFHTMVGSLAGTRAMFLANGYGGTESHFGTGGGGELEQWQDTRRTADANYLGNPTVISVENADLGPGFTRWDTQDGGAVPAFTDAQVRTLIALGTAACLAFHAQGVPANGLVSGGVQWSQARGKVCPGRRRIAQLRETIVPMISAQVAGDARVPAPAKPPAAPVQPAAKPPAFPLPAGHWFGPESRDPRNHSGYAAKDRPGILTWQAQMRRRGWGITATGRFTAHDSDVAAAFQREKYLDDDGLVGAKTWAASWTAKVT